VGGSNPDVPASRILAAGLVAVLTLSSGQANAQGFFDFFRRKPPEQTAPPPPPKAPARPRPAAPPRPKPPAPPPAAVAPPVVPAKPAVYEKDLRRLGEILGALHYLRPLCGASDGAEWRNKMDELIAAEAGPQDRRERLAGAFNTGYSSFEITYRSCTPSAQLAVQRYLDEGAKLTRDIGTRHGY
jgi:uncharacterized protein (TIGR02301 family)